MSDTGPKFEFLDEDDDLYVDYGDPPPFPKQAISMDTKVKSGAGWGFVTVLVFFVIKIVAPDVHAQITPEVSSSFTIAVSTFAAWYTKNK